MMKKKINVDALYFEVNFNVLKSNRTKYEACLDKIEKLYDESEPIPADLFKEFTEYFFDVKKAASEIRTQKYIGIAQETIEYFSLQKDYHFKATSAENVEFHFDSLMYAIIQAYYSSIWNRVEKGELKEQDKYDLLRFFYETIEKFTGHFDEPGKPLITDYKKIVIAAYFTQKLGYPVCSVKNPSNKQLYNGAKYAFEKKSSPGKA
jgi:hypothetical protein